MKSYCGNKREYCKYLTGRISWNDQYIDPDSTYSQEKSLYYRRLAAFLNIREQEGRELYYEFFPVPVRSPIDVWRYELDSLGIRVVDENTQETVMHLRSDQFGFSAPKMYPKDDGELKESAWDDRYPYASYLHKGGSSSFVANCIWRTRTLGGAFLWPIKEVKNKGNVINKSIYNMRRGVNGYIEDSVDFTLYEIFRFYRVYEENSEEDCDFIRKKLKKEGLIIAGGKKDEESDFELIYKWLAHFESFENYIGFFMLNPFVREVNGRYRPVNLVREEYFLRDEEVRKYIKEKDCAKYRIRNLDKDDLKKMFSRLMEFVEERTEKMERKVGIK